jgi:uncharacterized protein YutE (UPF0331/DUF86 family)
MDAEQRERLIKHLDFLRDELSDFEKFRKVTWKAYAEDRDLRRNLERWIENLVNCSIDIGKIVLAFQRRPIPDTYREVLLGLQNVLLSSESFSDSLSRWARLRNILAHDYLDMRWNNIKAFIQDAEPVFKELVTGAERILTES